MCNAVLFQYQGHELKTEFKNPQAKLPVRTKTGECVLLPWGRRPGQAGQLPIGGWARLVSIKAGRWDKFSPRSVKIPLLQFMEEDYTHYQKWYQVVEGQYVQGLIAHYEEESRIYIVTIVPEHENATYDRWPRIILNSKQKEEN